MRRRLLTSIAAALLALLILGNWPAALAAQPKPDLRPPSGAQAWDPSTEGSSCLSAGRAASKDLDDLAALPRRPDSPRSDGLAGFLRRLGLDGGQHSDRRGPTVSSIPLSNAQEYLTNTALDDRIDDAYLRGSLAYAYTCARLFRGVADAAAARGTTIRWETLPTDISGMYRPEQNAIAINSELRFERAGVMAATVAHELYHASHDTDGSVGSLLQEEIDAYGWEAYVWSLLGVASAKTPQESHLESLVQLWRSKELHNFVVTMPGYQRSLFGRVLESP